MGGSTSTSRGKFLATQAYIRQQGESQINNLTLNLKQAEKEQTKSKVAERKDIKIRAEINGIETAKNIYETKC